MSDRQCGSCTYCCKLPPIDEQALFGGDAFKKPSNTWCSECKIGHGCKIYAERPQSCVEYSCVWLSQPDVVPEELRPDKSKVIIEPSVNGANIVLRVDPTNPRAHLKRPFAAWLAAVLESGFNVIVFDGKGSLCLMPRKTYIAEYVGEEIAVDAVKRTVQFPEPPSRAFTYEELRSGSVR